MSKVNFKHALGAAAAVASLFGATQQANAAMAAYICNDQFCNGGNDLIVMDNAAGDAINLDGIISINQAMFGGFVISVNTSQSKPLIGSATLPQMDINFAATTLAGSSGSIWMYVADTNFIGGGTPLVGTLTIGGTNSGGSGTVSGIVYGGANNALGTFSNSFGNIGPLSGAAYSDAQAVGFTPISGNYALTLGIHITRTTAGTSTGDLNFAVPEPATMALLGLGMLGLGFSRRRAAQRA